MFYIYAIKYTKSVIVANANRFLPVAGLADVAEYTAKKIIELVTEVRS
jgi:hypothetical protein